MKPAQIFHQYIWIINTLGAYRKLTLEELNKKWMDDGVADGNHHRPVVKRRNCPKRTENSGSSFGELGFFSYLRREYD